MLKRFRSFKTDNYKQQQTTYSLQTCTVTIDADTLTATAETPVTLIATVSPPGTYDVNFKYGDNPINQTPITTNSDGIATYILDATGQPPGLYDFTAEVVSPESCISSPITLALTDTLCEGISITDPTGSFTANIGDIIPVSISATITQTSIAELIDTEFGMRAGSCILDPSSGNCIINVETTGAPSGIYHVAAYIGYGTAQQCVSSSIEVTLQETPGKMIVVSIPPGADIYYEGDDTGINSSAIISDIVPNVPHDIRLTLSGYEDYTDTITLDPGETGFISTILIPLTPPTGIGDLNVTSTPDGVEFGLYTGEMDTAPVILYDVPAGINAYEAGGIPGYNGAMGSVIINAGETTDLNIPLLPTTPDMGIVAIESIPMGADIYIEGSPINAKTSFMTSMPSGDYTYELRLSGYQNKSGSFTVVTGYDNPAIVSEILPANIISATLTIEDPSDCIEYCSVDGTVSWTNPGITPSSPTDLSITYNGDSISIDSAVVLGPGETTTEYPFTISDLAAGIYTVQASPNDGTTPQTITVKTPANIIVTAITPSITTCIEPCDLTVNVTWTNDGGVAGEFVPTINIDDVPISPAQYTSESLDPDASITRTFTITNLMKGLHTICANPGTLTDCATINVEQVAMAGFGNAEMTIIAGLAVGAVLMSGKPIR